ncbi:helix-turn-helix transcriptional regulator [Bradyrhizobium sp. UFLA05-112]
MFSSTDKSLINLIYEASFVPERWQQVLNGLSAIAGCEQGAVFQVNGRAPGSFVSTEPARGTFESYFKEGWNNRDIITARMLERRPSRFMTTWDLFEGNEFEQTEYYREFAEPRGLGSCCGSLLPLSQNEFAAIVMARPWKEGPIAAAAVKKLNLLHPHLTRSFSTASRLAGERIHGALDILSRLHLPACALTSQARLRLWNPEYESLAPQVVAEHPERLAFIDPAADRVFAAILTKERSIASERAELTFPIKSRSAQPPCIGHLVPIRVPARDIFSSAEWLLILRPVILPQTINAALIETLFDLTTAETAIAGGLLTGKTLHQIAEERQSSVQTVRSQLKAIMSKTRTNRQLDVVRLLSETQLFVE